jgi:hypothetical protein
VQGFYTTTLLNPGIFADLIAEFSLDRGFKPFQESLLPREHPILEKREKLFATYNRE